MKKDLVSIVIPVYNVEKFLPDCFLSLKNLTYKNIEVIFVNDGSTDNSLKLLQQFCKDNKYARIISQINKGVAVARTVGLKSAKGAFLYWLDPDDIIHPQIIEIFVNIINKENADFVCGCCKKTNESTRYDSYKWRLINDVKYSIYNKNNIIDFISGKHIGTNWSLQVKLYRMSTIKSVPNFPYIIPANYSRGEDLRFNSALINYCKKAIVVKKVLHLWRQRNSSLTHASIFNVNDLNVLNALDPYLNFKLRSKAEQRAIFGNLANQAMMLLCVMKKTNYNNLDNVEYTYKIFKENKKYCFFLKHHPLYYVFLPFASLYLKPYLLKVRKLNKK